jgi:S-DNA-T family DNA segregation ATPase FtsK/SpoIIIE
VSSEDTGDLVVVRGADVEDAESVRLDTREELGKPVDPPDQPDTLYGTVMSWEDAPRRPIAPAWVRNAEQRLAFLRWLGDYTWYAARLHVSHSPKYLAKTLWYAPIGAGRMALRLAGWWFDKHGFLTEQSAVAVNDSATFFKARREVNARRLFRGIILVAVLFALLITYACVKTWGPWWMQASLVVVSVAVLARAGRPVGQAHHRPAHDGPDAGQADRRADPQGDRADRQGEGPGGDHVPRPTSAATDPVSAPIVDLPDGVIAADVIDERDRLAAGFRLPKVQVWPAMIPREHPGRLEIWIADRPLDRMTPPAWPLLKQGQIDYFRSVPVGYDPRLRTQYWDFAQKNSLLAGIPGSGKSLDARVLILGAVLDPLVIPAAFELKGTGDYRAVKPMCPEGFYGSGADQATKQAMFDFIQWLEDECDRRGPLVEKYAAMGLSEDNNVNRAMAEKDSRLRPIVAVLDEIQELFTDKELGKQAKATAISVVKRGRALAIHLIPCTQRIDKDSIPRGLSSNIALRACGAVTAHTECDLVLGTGAYSRGARPTEFETAVNDDPKDSGWVWRVGLGPQAPMRFYYISNKQAEQIAARAMKMREGLEPVDMSATKAQAYNLLDDVNAVWPSGQDQAWSEVLLKGLAALRPNIYGEWTADTLAKALKGYYIATAQTWGADETGKGRNRRGIARADLLAAITSQREGRKARAAVEIEADE